LRHDLRVARASLYWTRLLLVIAILSVIVGALWAWVDQRAGLIAAVAAGVVAAPIFGLVVSRVARRS